MTRVAAYCRVSTDKTDQVHSFQSQKAFFIQYIGSRPDWRLTGIYADEGITGTTAADRAGFLQMIDDAQRGAFDILITKEVSRFSRNILDAIAYTRKLKEAGVGVVFLNDGISTLEADAELRLGIMAAVAQEESRRTSERVRWGQTRKMENGVVFGRSLLGYKVKNGRLSVEPDGAETVRRIFAMYLEDRLGIRMIAKFLTENRVPTHSGGFAWTGASVLKILRNEKYCGDLVQKKTVTTNFLTHKKVKNTDGLICLNDHHEPIITREAWKSVQTELDRRSRTSKNVAATGTRYALSGRIVCAGCGAVYLCRTRKRKNGSAYRVWSCPRCSCQGKHSQIREEVLAGCVRHIVSSAGEALLGGFREILMDAMKTREDSIMEYEKRITEKKNKKLKLIDAFLTGELSRDEYAVMKEKYDTELEGHYALLTQLKGTDESSEMSELMKTASSLANGVNGDDDFYLSLINKTEVVNEAALHIFLLNSVDKWVVEF